ncbi:sensor histidine kinase [Sphingobium sufflavum]|uniref:sensor histidine kinase n=1 Tax=Sphingobium sufflavum TaxID=1129547 RepID=UPI001F1BD80D|nr:ATP-binding protein [Sphingobium sufflavum]MCE7797819.1 sensor histidine kinase [Sphingobium sufflavum]
MPRVWPLRVSLARRILAVNILALALLAGGFFYLDSYRTRIIDERINRITREMVLMSTALRALPADERPAMIARLAGLTGYRVRLYGPDGHRQEDSVALGVTGDAMVDPATEPLNMRAARVLDQVVDSIVFARVPPLHAEPRQDSVEAWPEALTARATHTAASAFRLAPDRTPMLTIATPFDARGSILLATKNARDITITVRAERLRLSLVLGAAILISYLLSRFLARTIVQPLQRLARAAVRVRLGRAREVIVPRLPDRRDEIGLLARAISDMSQALRKRIDATDSFAADVSHELKNPIASLRSALEGLRRIDDPALRSRLMAIAEDDVLRLDRLVSDIAEASRMDAQLSRATFRAIDLSLLLRRLIRAHEMRGVDNDVRLRFVKAPNSVPAIAGDEQRLARVFENLIANGISFSPHGGTVRIGLDADEDWAVVTVEDEGPGVHADDRESVFRRFHSHRPDGEDFGRHSGLGLAIARSILDGHNGTITIEDRADGQPGARFIVHLPLAEELPGHEEREE